MDLDHPSDGSASGTAANVFEAIAGHFDRTRQYPWKECVRYLGALPRPSTVLDMGCGNGRHMLVGLDDGHTMIGVDRTPGLLRFALEHIVQWQTVTTCIPTARYGLVRGDVRALPLCTATIDHGLYIATVHHLTTAMDRRQSILELARVLRPGGTALISAWAVEQPRFSHLGRRDRDHDVMIPWTRDDGTVFQRYYHLYDHDEFVAVLTVPPLSIERVEFQCENWYGWVRRV